MEYRKVSPAIQLSHSIESYIFLNTDLNVSMMDTFFPNGKPAIVFHFKSPFYFRNIDGQWVKIPNIGLIGCQSIPVGLKIDGAIDSISIMLQPYSLFNLFKVKLEGLFSHVDATKYISKELIVELTKTSDIDQRTELLNDFFIKKIKKYNPDNDIFKLLCDYIIKNRGLIERKSLSDIFELSENYIHKLFIKKMGISFKPYSRIVRISNIIAEVYIKNNHDWIELLMEYGYFDQSHFIKDFKNITGKTPHQFYKLDKSLSSIFSGLA